MVLRLDFNTSGFRGFALLVFAFPLYRCRLTHQFSRVSACVFFFIITIQCMNFIVRSEIRASVTYILYLCKFFAYCSLVIFTHSALGWCQSREHSERCASSTYHTAHCPSPRWMTVSVWWWPAGLLWSLSRPNASSQFRSETIARSFMGAIPHSMDVSTTRSIQKTKESPIKMERKRSSEYM